ncbi:MAG: selenocysteine-specific translation elongation factor [Nitrospirota bacterium]
MRHIILGTAGHIDHGKSALVKALTGIDPDRLKEEKERGITIDLGFAYLEYPDGITVGIVDVPGHERLIKNMLAGAGGIDIVLLVVAADEGVMPQTREHLAICNLLKIKRGIIVVTKVDLVDEEWLSLVIDDIRNLTEETFLKDAPLITVSSKTGQNIELLQETIRKMALETPPKSTDGLFRLPVDRVFTMKGFGTVVTGTLLSGKIPVGDTVEILPGRIKTKVRGIQSHNIKVQEAFAGQRTALNLQGIEKEEIVRGDAVTLPGMMTPTFMLDASFHLLKDSPPLKNRTRIRLHIGTSEAIGRILILDRDEIAPGESSYIQLRVESPVIALSGDHFIIRRYSPLQTLGGGMILEPLAKKHKRGEEKILYGLKILEYGNLEEKFSYKINTSGVSGISLSNLRGWIDAENTAIKNALISLSNRGEIILIDKDDEIYLHIVVFNHLKDAVLSAIEIFHRENPLKPGMSKEGLKGIFKEGSIKVMNRVLYELERTGKISVEKELVRLSTFMVTLEERQDAIKEKILRAIMEGGTQPPMKEEMESTLNISHQNVADILKLLTRDGLIVRINDSLYFHVDVFNDVLNKLKEFFKQKKEITVAEFRDMINTSRKYAVPLIEYLDTTRVTLRVGDKRIPR